jgi:two-component system, NarL family, response regulator NreC
MTETEIIRILIADDFKVLRDVIRLHLERAGDMDVVDEAPDLDDALERISTLQPDVVIMNDYLPPVDSAHATARFRELGFTAAILVISMHLEPSLIQRSLLNGANGFMHKDEIDEYLVAAIRRVHQGERYLSPKAGDAYSSIQE